MNRHPEMMVCIGGPAHGSVVRCLQSVVYSMFPPNVICRDITPPDWNNPTPHNDFHSMRTEYYPREVRYSAGGLTLSGWALVWRNTEPAPEVVMMSLLGFIAFQRARPDGVLKEQPNA